MIDNPQLNKEPIKVNRALISVFDKTGVIEFAQKLEKIGVEILSTGGTAKILKDVFISFWIFCYPTCNNY